MTMRTIVIIFLIILVAPIIVMVPLAFNEGATLHYPIKGFSVKWFETFFESNTWIKGFLNSLKVAITTAIFATILALMGALAADRLNFPFKRLFELLMITPLIIPMVVIGLALYSSLNTIGLNNTILGLTLSHIIVAIPLAFVTIYSRLKSVDITLEHAAQNLGSTPFGAFMRISFPLIRSSIFASFLFAFIISLDEVIISLFVSGPLTKTLPVVMYENMSTEIDPTIAAVSTLLIALVLLLFILFPRIIHVNQRK